MNRNLTKVLTFTLLLAMSLGASGYSWRPIESSATMGVQYIPVSGDTSAIGFAVDDDRPVRTEMLNGLSTTTFDTLVGTVTVNLPDDLAAGDTISGTVIAEPKKQDTPKDKVDDQGGAGDEISGYVVEVAKQAAPTADDKDRIPFCKAPTANTNDYSLTTCKKWSIPDGVSKIPVVLKNKEGKVIGRTDVPVAKKPDPANAAVDFFTPPVGQAGKPVAVKGPFDGDFKNTAVKVGNQVAKFLASSPRKVIVESPRDLKGPANIEVEHQGKMVAKCTYRSVSVKLGADKLNLIKGETTSLSLTLTGLTGLTSPLAVQLSNHSVSTLSMDGGNLQTVKVEPSQVNGDIYTTRRGLTGLSAGGFSITAVVDISSYAQGNMTTCGPPAPDIPRTPDPSTSPPRPDPNPTVTPTPAPQPPQPERGHGRFLIALNGFRVHHVTNHGLFQRPDAVRFQPEIFSVVVSGPPLVGGSIHGGSGHTIGSSDYPVRGGSAPGGGFRNGDGFPDQTHPERRTLPLSSGIAATPPTRYYQNYETELVQGVNAVVIIPTIWSVDNNAGLGLCEQFLEQVGSEDARLFIRNAVRRMIETPPAPALGNYLVPGSSVSIFNRMHLAIGVPQDRPIGMRLEGSQYGFVPQVLVLSYDSADFMSRNNFGFGIGIVPVRYTDDPALGGDYELYFQVERVGP